MEFTLETLKKKNKERAERYERWKNASLADTSNAIDVCSICSERGGTWVKREDCTCTKPCPDCFLGEIEVRDDAREFDINERWKTVICETCSGEGEL